MRIFWSKLAFCGLATLLGTACTESTAPAISQSGMVSSETNQSLATELSSTGISSQNTLSSTELQLSSSVNAGMSSAMLSSSATSIVGCPASITDARDGNVYRLTQIGNQCWMADHLNHGSVLTSTDAPGLDQMLEKYCEGNDPSQCVNGASYL